MADVIWIWLQITTAPNETEKGLEIHADEHSITSVLRTEARFGPVNKRYTKNSTKHDTEVG
jgi:hypothetical protein